MRKTPVSKKPTQGLPGKKLFGLTIGLFFFLDSANQALAHNNSIAGWAPPPSPSPVSLTNQAHTNAGGTRPWPGGIDVGKSYGTVPLLSPGLGHSTSSGSFTSSTAVHRIPLASTSLTSAIHNGAATTELGQPGQGLDLDLTSTASDIVLGSRLFGGRQSVIIDVGGVKETFRPGSTVTSAQYVAIEQVLGGAAQSITVNDSGAATGGSFSLNAVDKANLTGLVIPVSVTALDYMSKNATISLNGDLTNYGSIDALSTSSKITSGTISATDITNEVGATISTVLPGKLSAAISGAAGADTNSNLNLTLQAANDLTNAGSITSSGTLNLSVGGSIVNALPTGAGSSASAASPTIQATNNVNLSSGSGNFTNAGLIASINNNINITSPNATANININGAGGTFQALAGNINVRDSSYAGSGNINAYGGNYLSQNLNLYSGAGTITGIVGQVTGNLNTDADVEHFGANTTNLALGSNTVKGDPTFASTGNITITGLNSFGEDVALLAQGNITATSSAAEILDNGNNVTLIAGATVTVSAGGTINGGSTDISGTAFNISGGTGNSPGTGSFTATADFTKPTGGLIDLTASTAPTVIDTSNAVGTGGNIILVAIGSGTTGGTVNLLSTSTINTSSATAAAGSVLILACASPSTAATTISIGNISASGSASGATPAGQVQIYTQAPTAGQVVFNQNGALTSGVITNSGTTVSNAGISVGTITTAGVGANGQGFAGGNGGAGGAGGNVSIVAGGSISTNSVQTFGGGGGGGSNGSGGAGGNGGAVFISSSAGSITINGNVNTSGGGGGGGMAFSGGGGGDANNITIDTPATFSSSGPLLAAGGGGGGGNIAGLGGGGGGSFGGGGGGGGLSSSGGGGSSTVTSGGGIGFGGGGGGSFAGPGGFGSNATFIVPGGAFGIGGSNFSTSPGAGSGGSSGQPGTGGMFGSGGNGGVISITGQSVSIPGLIGSASQGWPGFGSSPNATDSVNALGPGGTIAITSTGGSIVTTGGMTASSSINLNANASILTNEPLTSPTINLAATTGNLGASNAPLIVSGGASGVAALNLNIMAPAGTPGNGNAWITDSDADPASGPPAVFLNAVVGSGEGVSNSGLFSMTETAGSIGFHPTEVVASSQIVLVAENSIIQKHGEILSAPVISLTALTGNIGLNASTPLVVTSGSSGTIQLSLSLNATATTTGNGNIYIFDGDSDRNTGVTAPALLLGASAANGIVGDATTGNFQVTTSTGSIGVAGVVTATNSITFNTQASVMQTAGGSLNSPTINLTSAAGNIGSSSAALVVSCGTPGLAALNLNVIAPANTFGNGNAWLVDNDPDPNPAIAPAAVLVNAIVGSGTPAAQSGSFTLTETAGSIGIHPTEITASSQIVLVAQNSIVQKHGEVLSAPSISLTATTGNIGLSSAIPFIVSSGLNGTALQLTANALANTSGNGNIYITDSDSDMPSGAPALLLGASAAGSGTPVDATTGNFQLSTTVGGVATNGAVTATTSISVSAFTNIMQANGGSLASPIISLAATTGNIGLSPVPVSVNASGSTPSAALALSANAGGNVFLTTGSTALTLNASSGNTFVLTTTGTGADSTINNISANNITLQSQTASNGSFTLTGTIGGQTTTDANNATISAGGSGSVSYSSGSVNTSVLTLSSGTGTLGTLANPIVTDAATITASTGASGGVSGVYIIDANAGTVSVNPSSAQIFNLSSAGSIVTNGNINAPSSLTLVANSGNLSYTASPTNSLSLSAPSGTLSLPSNQLSVNTDGKGNGGFIELVAANLSYPGASTLTPLILNAQGAGTGNGGQVFVTLNSNVPVIVNNAALNPGIARQQVIEINAQSGSDGGGGGTASVDAGGSLTVNPAFISAAPTNGNGATIFLQAGTTLLVTGALNASAVGSGSGGIIQLLCDSATTFNIGSTAKTTTNGVQGLVSVNGTSGNINGSLTAMNLGGGLTNSIALTAVNNLDLEAGGAGTLAVAKPIGSSSTTRINLQSDHANITSATTSITSGSLVMLAGGNIAANAGATSAFTFSATNVIADAANGVVLAGDTNHDLVDLGNSAAGKSFTFSTGGSLDVNGQIGNPLTGAVTLKTANNGNITVDANIFVNSSPSAAKQPAHAITLNANGSGSIIAGAIGILIGNSVVLLSSSGAIGNGLTPLQAFASILSANTKGLVAVNNQNTNTATLSKSTGTSITFSSGGSLTLNSISATGGAINITADTQLGSSTTLETVAGAQIKATNGAITLASDDTSAGGQIVFGKGTTIATAGTKSNLNVAITLGTASTSLTSTAPTNIKVVTGTGGGTAKFSPAGITAVTPINTVNLKGSNVTIDAGNSGLSGTIKLNGGVAITADPIEAAVFGAIQPVTTSISAAGGWPGSIMATEPGTTASIAPSFEGLSGTLATSAAQTLDMQAGITAINTSVSSIYSAVQNAAQLAGIYSSSAGITSSQPVTAQSIASGLIPAIISGDPDLAVIPEFSTVIDLQEHGRSNAHSTKVSEDVCAGDAHLIVPGKSPMPLAGSVSRYVGALKCLSLNKGSVVFAPTVDTVVNTPFAQVNIRAGSIVFVMAFGQGIAVYNMHDLSRNSVVVTTGGHVIALSPAMQAVITSSSEESFEQINPAQMFGYRRLTERDLGQGLKAFTSEFSTVRAISVVLPLKQLAMSNNAHAQKCLGRMLKDAAIIEQVRATTGSYELFQRPGITACAGQ